MTVKYWSRAGLMLTDWCNAACACCYANCGPDGSQWLAADDAARIWAGLIDASPHGCRVHLTGGEVFGRFEHLLAVCRLASARGVGPLESVETNGFWAIDEALVRQRLEALAEHGMGRLAISTDPYHQQYVPIERVRLLARVAGEVLGPEGVRVRWQDWLADGGDTSALTDTRRSALFQNYAEKLRDRFTGRAAEGLDGGLSLKPARTFDDNPCRESLLRGRHVHISPTGEVWPATCVGIVVGNVLRDSASVIWDRLNAEWSAMPVLGPLCQRGPAGLLDAAQEAGFVPRKVGYAGKCQLCYHLRRYLAGLDGWHRWLGPLSVYRLRAERGSLGDNESE